MSITDMDNSTRMVLLLLIGAAIFEVGRELREATPDLHELRVSDDDDTRHKYAQHLVDGQAMTGIMVAGAALVAAWACGHWFPGLVLIGVYAALVWFQHDILRSPNTCN